MPRDNDKNNDSRGRRDRPSGGKGRSGAARGPEKKFAKRGFAGKRFASRRRQARWRAAAVCRRSRTARKSLCQKPYSGDRNPTPRSPMPAAATALRRASATATRRVRAATGRRLAIVRSVSTGMTVRRATIAAARSAPTPRAASEAMPGRPRASPTRNSATRSPTRRARVAARSGPTRRAATGRRATVRTVRGRRAMATGRAATGRSENSAATRSFPAARPDRGPRKDFGSRDRKSGPGDRGDVKAVAEARCVFARSRRPQFPPAPRRRA